MSSKNSLFFASGLGQNNKKEFEPQNVLWQQLTPIAPSSWSSAKPWPAPFSKDHANNLYSPGFYPMTLPGVATMAKSGNVKSVSLIIYVFRRQFVDFHKSTYATILEKHLRDETT